VKARHVLAALLVLAPLGGAGWAYWTADARRLAVVARAYEEEREREPRWETRPVLRGKPVEGDVAALAGPRLAKATVAEIRSALAAERVSGMEVLDRDELAHLDLEFMGASTDAFTAAWRERGSRQDAADISLDLWRFHHDLVRAGAFDAVHAVEHARFSLELEKFALLLSDLDATERAEVRREVEVLIATRPSFASLVRRSRLAFERDLVEKGRIESPEELGAVPSWEIVESAASEAEGWTRTLAPRDVLANLRAAKEAAAARSQGHGNDRAAFEALVWESGESTLRLLLRDHARLTLVHAALLAFEEHLRTERWPASLDERDPVTGAPLVLAVDEY
jgi:hypothetical protein